MKSTELRLGNYIWWLHEESESVNVVDLEILETFVYNEEDPSDSQDRFARFGFRYAPIPLTEEWLLKFGFDNTIDDELPEDADFLVFFKDNYSVEIIPDDLGIKSKFIFGIYQDIIDSDGEYASELMYEQEVEHIHELQNLVFAFTKKELTIKD